MVVWECTLSEKFVVDLKTKWCLVLLLDEKRLEATPVFVENCIV